MPDQVAIPDVKSAGFDDAKLRKGINVASGGVVCGYNMGLQQTVYVQSRSGTKTWEGMINGSKGTIDNVPAWSFEVKTKKFSAEPEQGDETIVVTVTNSAGTSSPATVANPQPNLPD